jgi:hypothetical protein
MHQQKWIHKDILKEMFPRKESEIDAAGIVMSDFAHEKITRTSNDMLLVVESWHLPSGPKAKDGKHTICIDNVTLFHEEYKFEYFPFVFFRWNERPLGFFGQGIAEQLTGLQVEINKILRTIQVSMHLVSVPKIFVEAGSKIVSSHIDNKIGGIIKYAGTAPTPGKLGSIPPELFAHLDRLYGRAYEIIGISQLSSQSTKPAGLNSGKALRTFNDIETERFMSVGLRYEQTFLDATRIMIDLAKEISEETGNYSVKVPGSDFLSTINWKDVEMDEDQYVMKVYPTNAFSQTPAAKFQEVQEWMQAGLLSREEGLKLLDFPDTKSITSLINGPIQNIEKQIEMIVEKGAEGYQGPEPYQSLKMGIRMFQNAYLKYQAEGAPEDVLELFRQWIAEADTLMKNAQAEIQQQQQMNAEAQAATIAQPAAQPTSDLLPVA